MTDLRDGVATRGGAAVSGLPPAGWYPDPADDTVTRWWSGQGWTEYIAPAVIAVPAPEPEVPAGHDTLYVPEVVAAPTLSDAPAGEPEVVYVAAAAPAEPAPFAPNLSIDARQAAAQQYGWHDRAAAPVRRAAVVPVSAPVVARRADDFQPNWIAGVAFTIALLSIPALAARVLLDYPALTQSILAGAPISIALLALVTSARRGGRGIVLSIISVVVSAAVLTAGIVLPEEIIQLGVDAFFALLPTG